MFGFDACRKHPATRGGALGNRASAIGGQVLCALLTASTPAGLSEHEGRFELLEPGEGEETDGFNLGSALGSGHGGKVLEGLDGVNHVRSGFPMHGIASPFRQPDGDAQGLFVWGEHVGLAIELREEC